MSVKVCCVAFKVHRAGYYRWVKSEARVRREARQTAVLSEIKLLRKKHPGIGVDSLQKRMSINKVSYGNVYKLCQENNLMAYHRPKGCTNRDPNAEIAKDLVQRHFYAEQPMTKLFNDITEMKCKEGKLYLAVTQDAFDGAIVGMRMDNNKRAELCKASYESAINRYGKTENMIVHSDHGSQYTSHLFRDFLDKTGARQSMGGTGCCYDNARVESFFSTFKRECIGWLPMSQMSREEVKRAIFLWIECDYNTNRPHSGNANSQPPLQKREAYRASVQAA